MGTSIGVTEIHEALRKLGGWGSVYVPEFTYGKLRIDAAVIDIKTRWIRGFEVKVSRSDYLRDEKWHLYSQFCSSLSIACPEGLIKKEEVPDPCGLLYIINTHEHRWIKKPKRFQKRGGLAWTWTYLSVIEKELPRLVLELEHLRTYIKDNHGIRS